MKLFYCLILLALSGSGLAQSAPVVITTNAARDLIPEGIAVDKNTIYISSINHHLILAVDEMGKTRNFIRPNQDGFSEGLGMKVNSVRGWLWALSNKKDSSGYTSNIHAFELGTGRVQKQYTVRDTTPHLFNDLEIDDQGKIYITDTYYSALYTFEPQTGKLDLFLKSPYLDYPNGLAFTRTGKLIIATYKHGPMQLDAQTKNLKPLQGYKDSVVSHSLDGLVYRNNILIGVYNNSDNRSTQAIVQYKLDANAEKIVGEQWIDRGNLAFFEPTTAALSGNTVYVLANSHLAQYNANKESTKGIEAKLLPPVILLYKLSN